MHQTLDSWREWDIHPTKCLCILVKAYFWAHFTTRNCTRGGGMKKELARIINKGPTSLRNELRKTQDLTNPRPFFSMKDPIVTQSVFILFRRHRWKEGGGVRTQENGVNNWLCIQCSVGEGLCILHVHVTLTSHKHKEKIRRKVTLRSRAKSS